MTMYWEENKQDEYSSAVSDEIVDLAYSITCKSLPVDHAYALSEAMAKALPWFVEDEYVGLHTIHVAESGNGWFRPDEKNALLHPSRRTKLVLRVTRNRIDDANELIGKILDISGCPLQIDGVMVRPLSTITTIFSRYVVADRNDDEQQFLSSVMAELNGLGIKPKKMLCGKEKIISIPAKTLLTRSLMIADISVDDSVTLQQKGLGEHRKLGCGLFIPHKGINEV